MRTYREIIVVDGFYNDPLAVREHALGMKYGVKGNYPGKRTEPLTEGGSKEHLEYILDIKINIIDWNLGEYTGTYQYVTKDTPTWVHSDRHTDWSCLIYLSPDPPHNSGTSFYKHKKTGSRMYSDNDGATIEEDGSDYSKWTREDVVSNVFNRALIFKGQMWHAADDYFGTDLKTGRLFQTFFFNENWRGIL